MFLRSLTEVHLVRSDTHVATLGLVLGLLVTPLVPSRSSAQEPPPPVQELEKSFPKKPPYSPYAGRHFPERVYWGDTHLHTSFSMDAGAFGCRLGPRDAYRFAKGQEVTASSGQPVGFSSAGLSRGDRSLRRLRLFSAAIERRPAKS